MHPLQVPMAALYYEPPKLLPHTRTLVYKKKMMRSLRYPSK